MNIGRPAAADDFGTFALVSSALVFAITAEESLGYTTLSVGGAHVDSYLVFCLFQGLLSAALFAAAPALGTLGASHAAERVSLPLLLAAALAGSSLAMACGWAGADAGVMAGFLLMACVVLAVKMLCLRLMSAMERQWAARSLFCAVLVQPLAAPLFSLGPTATWAVSGVASIAAALLLSRAGRRLSAGMCAPDATRRFAKPFSPSAPVLVGFFIMCTSISYLNPLSLYPHLTAVAFVTVTVLTHLAAALVFGALVFKLPDSSYVLATRGIGTVLIFSFVLLALFGFGAQVPRLSCTFLFSLFEFLSFMVIADVASYSTSGRLRLFSGFYALVRLATAFGILAGMADQALDIGASFSVLGIALAGASVVAALWLLTEQNLDAFFWGEGVRGSMARLRADAQGDSPRAVAQGARGSVEGLIGRRAAEIAAAHGLTAREGEVLALMASGRSSTYIAEQLGISSNTVRKHVSQVYAKCGVHSKQDLLTLVQEGEGATETPAERGGDPV